MHKNSFKEGMVLQAEPEELRYEKIGCVKMSENLIVGGCLIKKYKGSMIANVRPLNSEWLWLGQSWQTEEINRLYTVSSANSMILAVMPTR